MECTRFTDTVSDFSHHAVSHSGGRFGTSGSDGAVFHVTVHPSRRIGHRYWIAGLSVNLRASRALSPSAFQKNICAFPIPLMGECVV